jgi:hypothetical protein
MPWAPELFTAPVLQRVQEKLRVEQLVAVPFFDGVLAGEPDALVESFVGEPELNDPVRGRVKGTEAFAAYIADLRAWLVRHAVSVEPVDHVVLERRGFEELVLHLDGPAGRADLPYAIVADRTVDGRIEELRIYYSSWPMAGRHAIRSPLLQRDPGLREPSIVAEYQRALAAGDVDAIVATFAADGYAREPAGAHFIHRGHEGLRAFYELMCSNGGGIPLEHCALIDDGRACALEYNVVRWGTTELPPQAGVAVYVRGPSGKLAAARIYDDADPPLGQRS